MSTEFDKKEEFLKAYDELSPALFRRFSFKLSDHERALDLVQETFTKAWIYIVEGKEVKNLKSFLYTIANNLIIDEYRKKKSLSLEELSEGGMDFKAPGEGDILKDLEIQNSLQAIEKLPKKYQEVINMRYVDGLSPSEIAEILGESENVVSVRINRAIKKIKDILQL